MNTDWTGFYTYKEYHKTESLWNHTTTDQKEGEQLEDRRNVGESSCNSGDGMDQRVQFLMFMMMMMMMMITRITATMSVHSLLVRKRVIDLAVYIFWLRMSSFGTQRMSICHPDESIGRTLYPAYVPRSFDVFLTVHHSIDLFHLPTLMHNSFIH